MRLEINRLARILFLAEWILVVFIFDILIESLVLELWQFENFGPW